MLSAASPDDRPLSQGEEMHQRAAEVPLRTSRRTNPSDTAVTLFRWGCVVQLLRTRRAACV